MFDADGKTYAVCKISSFGSICIARFKGEISNDLYYSRHDINPACCTQNEAGYKAREMRVFPNSKDRQRPIDGDRNQRKKQPESRYRLCLVDRAPYGIYQDSRKESEIEAKATRANRHLMPGNVDRSVRDLMTDVTEERIDR